MKPTELLLSVIIPVYNREKTLPATMETLLALKSRQVEIFLVNDGSTDGSLALCRAFAQRDDRVKVIDKKNGGVSSARNAGLEQATGKYVFFCDGDDLVVTETLERAVALIENQAEDLIIFDFQYYFLSNSSFRKSSFTLPPNKTLNKEEIVAYLIEPLICREGTDLASSCTKLFRSNTLKLASVCFEEKVAKGEDWRFVLDFLDACNTAFYVPSILYTYNLDGSQNPSKYKVVPGIHQLGSPKRRLRLIKKYAISTPEKSFYSIYCSLLREVAGAALAGIDRAELQAMFRDDAVQEAASAILSLNREARTQYGVLRRYRMMAYAVKKHSRFLLLFTIRLKNLFCRARSTQ